jgi:hypothetical protein
MEPPEEVIVERASIWMRPFVMSAVFIPFSLLGGLFPAFSLTANIYVLVLGAALLVAGMSSRVPRIATPTELPPGLAWWLLPVAIFVVFEVGTYVMGSTSDYPTLSVLADPLLQTYPVRSLAYFGWLTIFWGMVRR